jgi:hypothetical protein
MDINQLTEDQVKAVFQCSNSGCECHKSTGNVHCPCPGHANDDKKPSMSITKKDGKVLVNCFVCDDKEGVFKAVVEKLKQHCGDNETSQTREGGLTLQELSEVKKIPIENLKQWHVSEYTKGKKPYVIIPFHDENNKPSSTQFRFTMSEKPKWKKGNKPQLYGLWLLPEFNNDSVIMVEGASDCWTLWLQDIPAIGIPSKTGWRSGYAEYFKRFQNVYLWQEPDAIKLPGIIGLDIPGLKVLKPDDGFKDISEAHIKGLDVKEIVQGMIEQAIPYEPEPKEENGNNKHIEAVVEQEDKPKNGAFWIWKYDKREKAWVVKIYDYGFIKFLYKNGFGLLKMDNSYLYILVDKEKNSVKTFEPYQAKKFAMDYLEKLDYDKKEDVLAALHNVSDRLIKNNSLNSLRFCDFEFLKDTHNTAYFLFQNGFVSVTKDEIKPHAYSELKTLDRFIWETQTNKHDFIIDNGISIFEEFTKNVSSYRLAENELETETVKGEIFTEGAKGSWLKHSDYLSKVTAFGYLLHSYKNPSNAKAIVCVDAEIADSQEGGTGKSLFACKAIAEIKNLKECDGKKFIPGERFSFQGVNPSTQVVAVDDCNSKLVIFAQPRKKVK